MSYTVSEGLMPQFAIIATENNTDVEIRTTTNTTKHPAKFPYKIKLNKGEVYQVVAEFDKNSTCDLTGSIVRANKDIAVFAGHQCAYVTPRIIACNHLVEQMPPLNSWGKHFYLGKLKSRSFYTYRVLANEDETKVFEDSKLIKVLNAGEFYEKNSNKNIQITAGKPILLAQYSQGFRNGDSIGDPMMLLISPTQQFLKHYRFATPINGSWKHYVNVVVPTKAIGTLRLDSIKVDSALFEPLGISRYSLAHINVPFGTHTLECDMPFGMYSYGFGFGADAFDAYGNMGGQSFVDYEPETDTLPPMVEEKILVDRVNLIARDDRIDDTGLRRVEITYNEGFDFSIPQIEEGMPQVQFSASPKDNLSESRAVLNIYDANANNTTITLCYVFDPIIEKYVFVYSEGINELCKPDPGIQIGLFGKGSYFIHSAGFNSTAGYDFKGDFENKSYSSMNLGIYAGRRFFDKINISARFTLQKYSTELLAKGKIDSIRDEHTMLLVPYQEGKTIDITGFNLDANFAAEYFLNNYWYLAGGLNFSLNLSDEVIIKDRILQPADFTFSNNYRERTAPDAPTALSSISSLKFGLSFGTGINFPIFSAFSGFGEVGYILPLNSIISDNDWYVHQFSIIAGIKYKF